VSKRCFGREHLIGGFRTANHAKLTAEGPWLSSPSNYEASAGHSVFRDRPGPGRGVPAGALRPLASPLTGAGHWRAVTDGDALAANVAKLSLLLGKAQMKSNFPLVDTFQASIATRRISWGAGRNEQSNGNANCLGAFVRNLSMHDD
jgi:hypothetical protein